MGWTKKQKHFLVEYIAVKTINNNQRKELNPHFSSINKSTEMNAECVAYLLGFAALDFTGVGQREPNQK